MWVDVYGFDGFRFDGVTSMLYHSRGLGDGMFFVIFYTFLRFILTYTSYKIVIFQQLQPPSQTPLFDITNI